MFKKKSKYNCVFCSNHREKSKTPLFFCSSCIKIKDYLREYGVNHTLQRLQGHKELASAPNYEL